MTRVHDTGFIQLTADSFNDLTPDQKMDAYWLSMAAIAVNPIAYDQNSAYGLREKQLLEAILTHPKGIDPAVLKKITDYTMLFWGNHGNHNSIHLEEIRARFHFGGIGGRRRASAEERRGAGFTSRAREAAANAREALFRSGISADAHGEKSAEWAKIPAGQLHQLLFRRDAEGFDRIHRALRAEFAVGESGTAGWWRKCIARARRTEEFRRVFTLASWAWRFAICSRRCPTLPIRRKR